MKDLILNIYAVLAIAPFIPFLIVWLITFFVTNRDKKKATQLAVDLSTIFLIGSIYTLVKQLYDSNWGLYFVLFVLLLGFGLIGNMQKRKSGKVKYKKAFRSIWRIMFLMLCPIWIVLSLIVFAQSMNAVFS